MKKIISVLLCLALLLSCAAALAETAEKIRLYGWRAPGKALKKFLGRRKGRPF